MDIEDNVIARENMLKSQVLTGHVLSPALLEAFASVAREGFLPPSLQSAAYRDNQILLGGGRFLMEPLVFARLLEHAAIKPHETVLDVGSATGYSSAIISRLAQNVVAVEEDSQLFLLARTALAAYSNIALVRDSLTQGVSHLSPYDAIVIEGAVQHIPQALCDQLREGGRLLTVEHAADAGIAVAGLGRLVEYKKRHGQLYKTTFGDANVPLLSSFATSAVFTL